MRKKSPEELRREQTAKATRALIRLKHSLKADEEINAVLPDRLEEFDAALARDIPVRLAPVLPTVDEVLDASARD